MLMSNNRQNSDIRVDSLSKSLQGTTIDLVVGGSIGAVESVRFIRALRRLGARVNPIMSEGARLFTTITALEWASDNQVVDSFNGLAQHIATADFCLICPASASIISKVASGICDSPATTIIQSHIGQGNIVQLLPNMHNSLIDSPFINSNLEKIKNKITVLEPRFGEEKIKFPDPKILADVVSHNYLHRKNPTNALVCMGSTKGFIDEVRYISNYSSGGLGTSITEELFRSGFNVHVICGNAQKLPCTYSTLTAVETNDEMLAACKNIMGQFSNEIHIIMLASVLDYEPASRAKGKIRSGSNDLSLQLIPTQKIIDQLNPRRGFAKVGFKLEPECNLNESKIIATNYIEKYNLTKVVINSLTKISSTNHEAFLIKAENSTDLIETKIANTKQEISASIKQHIELYSSNKEHI